MAKTNIANDYNAFFTKRAALWEEFNNAEHFATKAKIAQKSAFFPMMTLMKGLSTRSSLKNSTVVSILCL